MLNAPPRPAAPPGQPGPAGHSASRISVIVPVRDGGDMFRAALGALVACEPAPHELIVVVDGRSDGAAALAASLGARVIDLPTTIGPARARNAGAGTATGDVLLFIDADVRVPPDLVCRVTRLFEDHPDVAAVIGSYDALPADPGFLSQYRNLLHHHVHQRGREDASTFWCGCGAIRREVFQAVGGLSGRFSDPSVEDIELGYRLRRAGHRIRLAKELQVTHLKCWTPLSLLRTDIFARAVPWTRLILRSGVLPNDLNVDTGSRASVALVFTLTAAAAASPWSAWAGWTATLSAAALLALNAGFYRFLWRARGPRFALAAVPWHWLYYACAGIGFMIGAAQELLGRPKAELAAEPAPGESRTP